jgi:hypothetical protein
VRDKIELKIVNDLLNGDIGELISKEYIMLCSEDIKKIYSSFKEKWFFKALINSLTLGPSLLCEIYSMKHDILKILRFRKGKFELRNNKLLRTGLRLKYGRIFSQEQIEKAFYSEEDLFNIFEFRVHTPDNIMESELLHSLLINIKSR